MLLRTLAFLFMLCFSARAETIIYSQDFNAPGATGWGATYSSTSDGNTVLDAPLGWRTDDGGAAASCCIYWNDTNHTSPGAGKVALLAWAYTSSIGLSSFDDWIGATVRLRIRADTGFKMPRWSRMVFWMQRQDPVTAKWWNMSYIGTTLDRELGFGSPDRNNDRVMATDWVDVEFTLTDKWRDWMCYGARPDKIHYACPTSPAQFLNAPMMNFGIHILYLDSAGPLSLGGEFRISKIEIAVP